MDVGSRKCLRTVRAPWRVARNCHRVACITGRVSQRFHSQVTRKHHAQRRLTFTHGSNMCRASNIALVEGAGNTLSSPHSLGRCRCRRHPGYVIDPFQPEVDDHNSAATSPQAPTLQYVRLPIDRTCLVPWARLPLLPTCRLGVIMAKSRVFEHISTPGGGIHLSSQCDLSPARLIRLTGMLGGAFGCNLLAGSTRVPRHSASTSAK